MREIRPQIGKDHVPTCSGVDCPAYRVRTHYCEITGHRPGEMCRPGVEQIAAELQALKRTNCTACGPRRTTT